MLELFDLERILLAPELLDRIAMNSGCLVWYLHCYDVSGIGLGGVLLKYMDRDEQSRKKKRRDHGNVWILMGNLGQGTHIQEVENSNQIE